MNSANSLIQNRAIVFYNKYNLNIMVGFHTDNFTDTYTDNYTDTYTDNSTDNSTDSYR